MSMDPVVIKRTFACTKRQLFDAWSKPELMAQWFYAGATLHTQSTVTSSFVVGGAYELIMHDLDQDHVMSGTYKTIIRYSHISFTWTSMMATDSLVALEFKELSPNRTEMTLTHSDFPSEESRNAHNEGWGRCLASLEKFLLGY
ncbi:SRPBCC domain-containing protein [Terasakiella sp. A23]|uniref:SRPBCC family protein n=1 Tax=Terasakiella sp. FCG-A23 TaxID=3080561 RepID=UPI002954F1B3|nr:SRPBCC domain-containing protein [Terasakiella sp. A23]MDV7339740.1 SRPBCC domain-containing protein [Terasakiella sp. A23]